jgi:hypothetical protein
MDAETGRTATRQLRNRKGTHAMQVESALNSKKKRNGAISLAGETAALVGAVWIHGRPQVAEREKSGSESDTHQAGKAV